MYLVGIPLEFLEFIKAIWEKADLFLLEVDLFWGNLFEESKESQYPQSSIVRIQQHWEIKGLLFLLSNIQ
jgi:hypothetical protein